MERLQIKYSELVKHRPDRTTSWFIRSRDEVSDCASLFDDRSKHFTVDRDMTRGRLEPTLISLRKRANGSMAKCPCRSRVENIDFTVAKRRLIVRGLTRAISAIQF